MSRWVRPAVASVVIVTIISASVTCYGQNFKASLGLEATVGLDEKTRNFIREMIPEVRAQMLGLLKDALPLVDQSVEKYMSRVDDILTKQVNNLQCTLVGTGKILGADLKSLITGRNPAPIQNLKNDEQTTVVSFSVNDAPGTYERRYADFLANAAVTRCQVGIAPEGSASVAKIQGNIRPRWMVWYRLDGICPNAELCFDYLRDQATQKITSSDARDTAKVHANDKLQTVAKPALPGFLTRFFTKYDPSEYEASLGALFAIYDGINMAQLARRAMAADAWSKASKGNEPQSPMRLLYANEYSQVNWPTDAYQDYTNAISRCKTLVAMIKDINADAKSAAELDTKYQPDYEKLRGELQSTLNTTYALYAKAASFLNLPLLGGHYPPTLPIEKLP